MLKKIRTSIGDDENIAIIMMSLWVLTGVLGLLSITLATFGIISCQQAEQLAYVGPSLMGVVGILSLIFD